MAQYFGAAKPYTITADGLAGVAGKGRLIGAVLTHTATTTAILYDNASAASGTKLLTMACAANDNGVVWFGDEGVSFINGCYCDWTAGVLTVYVAQ